jgi:hypothetical protein
MLFQHDDFFCHNSVFVRCLCLAEELFIQGLVVLILVSAAFFQMISCLPGYVKDIQSSMDTTCHYCTFGISCVE